MKQLRLLFLSLFIIVFLSAPAIFGTAVGDFQSAGTGDWAANGTWVTWNGSSWVGASSTPSSLSTAAVTILNGHTVTITASVSVRNVTINSGGKVAITGTATTGLLTVTDEGMTVNGTLEINGTAPSAAPYTVTMTTPAVLTVGATGVVTYNQGGGTTALPIATWQTGSTLNVTGITSSTSFKTGGASNYYNIIWNCPSQTSNFNWSFLAATIYGSVTVSSTGSGRMTFFASNSGTVDIMGDYIVTGSASSTTNGTSTAGTIDVVNVHGNVNVNTTGNFSISRGSQGGTGTATFNFYGDVSIIAGTMVNSTTLADGARFVFKKSGTQNFTLIPTTVTGNALPIEVDAGSTVNLVSPVNVTALYLNGGKIVSSTAHPLIMGWWNGTTVTSGSVSPLYTPSSTSYVEGPMAYLYATAAGVTSKTYPIGKGGFYRPLTLALTQTDATLSTYTAEMFNSAPPANTLSGSLTNISSNRYYIISETAGGSAFTAGSVKLSYDIGDGVFNTANLRIAQGPSTGGGTWSDLGGTGTGSPSGNITSTTSITSLSNTIFNLGNVSNGGTLSLTALAEGFFNKAGYSGVMHADDPATLPTVSVTLFKVSDMSEVETQTAALNSGGVGILLFSNAVNGTSYYLRVKSLTTLETWSADPGQSFTAGALIYDFTTAAEKSYASNQTFVGGKYCMFSGDLDHDGAFSILDYIGIDNDIFNFADYNAANDVDGDGAVTILDYIPIDNSIFNFIGIQAPPGAPTPTPKIKVVNYQVKASANRVK